MSFLIRSNFYVAFASGLLFLYYALYLGVDFFLSTPLLVMASTFLAYNGLRLVGIIRDFGIDSIKRPTSNTVFVFAFSLVSILILGFSICNLTPSQILILFTATIVVALYERLFFNSFSLRRLPFLKPFLIGAIWSAVCVGLNYRSLTASFILCMIDCFVFISFLSILFDFKDKEYDRKIFLRGFAQALDRRSFSKLVGVLSLIYSIFVISYFHFDLIFTIPFLVVPFYALRLLDHSIGFNYLVDGLIIYRALFGIYLLQN